MRFFGLKTCDTCRKARKALEAAGHTPEVIDVRADGIAPDDLNRIVETFAEASINRSSTTWRGLSDAEKAMDIKSLLEDYPTLLKRPVIILNNEMTIGWKADVQAKYLGDGT